MATEPDPTRARRARRCSSSTTSRSKRVAIRAMLAPLGNTVVEVDSGRAALQALLRQDFALILMDVRMPTMNGFETAKLCRQQRGSRADADHLHHRRSGGDESERRERICQRRRRLHLHAGSPGRAAGEGRAPSSTCSCSPRSCSARSSRSRRSTRRCATARSARRRCSTTSQTGSSSSTRTGVIESVNRSVGSAVRLRAGEPVGQPFAFMIAPERRDEFRWLTVAAGCVAGPGRAEPRRSRRVGSPQRRLDLRRWSSSAAELQHGDRAFTLACVRDISERKAHTEALEHLALHDGLTGLANRTPVRAICRPGSRVGQARQRAARGAR